MASIPQEPVASTPTSKVTEIPQTLQTTLDSAILKLNEEIVFVHKTLEIAELNAPLGDHELKFMSPNEFKNAGYSNRFIIWNKRRLYLAPAWLKSPLRRIVHKTVYEPGKPRITDENNLNTWFPSEIKPIKGDLTLFFRYLDHVFKADPTFREWTLAWAAYPLQNPGTKLNQAVVFWSKEQGTGKSTFAYILKHIYGLHNCSLIKEADFSSSFNGWSVGKQFIEVDELPEGARARGKADQLKSLITRQTVPVDLKYQNRYEIRDTMNFFYTSNHIGSLYLEPSDRRHFIHHVGEIKMEGWDELKDWLHNKGGLQAIRHYLEFEIDLSKPIVGGDPLDAKNLRPYSPHADAPRTQARQEVIQAGYNDVEAWIRDLLISPVTHLEEQADRTLWTAPELYALFHAKYPEVKCGPQGFSRALNAQLRPQNEGKQVRFGVSQLVLYLVTNDPSRVLTLSELKARLSEEREGVLTDEND